jgi:rhodanese-related sulfurtransferase/DNA-binding transcriptional ArsR family regulator
LNDYPVMIVKTENPKRQVYAAFASVARALGHEHRLELLELLAQGECAVETLAARSGLSIANASQHLQQLRRAGLTASRREGKNVLYRLAEGPVIEAVAGLRKVAEHNLAEVQQIVRNNFDALDAMEPVTRDELLERLHDGTALLLDVRPEDEFRQGHLPGAVNIAVRDLEQRLPELPGEGEIVAYCRGPYCLLSFEAVKLLRARGYKIRRLEDGYPEWKAAGLPVETVAS